MSQRDRLDPESRVPLEEMLAVMPGGFNSIPDIVPRRIAANQMRAERAAAIPPTTVVNTEQRTIPGPPGAPDITVRIYRPAAETGALPGTYFIHGGGMILGDLDGDSAVCERLCSELTAVVVSVEYRLAPEHPYPDGVEDCYAGLLWTADNASELGIDPARLAVFGMSAGGGLTIATCLLARDRDGPSICFQMPIYPMIDDRNVTASSREVTDVGIWDRRTNIEAWAWYLNGQEADGYAAPARATDLAGLPPTFIDVGDMDLFRDEDIALAARLLQSGVPVELHVYPGAYHGSEHYAPEADLSQRIWVARMSALRRAFGQSPRSSAKT